MSKSNEVFEFEGQEYIKSKRASSNAKVGDIVRITTATPLFEFETGNNRVFFNRVLEVTKTLKLGVNVHEIGGYITFNQFEILEPTPKTNPRLHAELIKQWADDDSLVVQFKGRHGAWLDSSSPSWSNDYEYRFRPETVSAWRVLYEYDGDFDLTLGYYKTEEEFNSKMKNGEKFIRFILETEKQVEA